MTAANVGTSKVLGIPVKAVIAMIAIRANDPIRFPDAGEPIYNTNGERVANRLSDMFLDGGTLLTAMPKYDETGQLFPGGGAPWTGADKFGNPIDDALAYRTCASWATNLPDHFGEAGNAAHTDYIWIQAGFDNCDQTHPLYGLTDVICINCGQQDIKLSNGVALNTTMTAAVSKSSWKYYYIDLPSGSKNLVVDLYNLSADLDLYMRQGSKPIESTYDCRSILGLTSNDQCSFTSPTSGRWWIGVYNYATGTISYTVKAKWSGGAGLPWQLLLLGN